MPRPLPEQGGHPNLALFTFATRLCIQGRRVDALDGRLDESVPDESMRLDVRAPSEFGMTTGSPPSMTAIMEFVVPSSIPTVLGI